MLRIFKDKMELTEKEFKDVNNLHIVNFNMPYVSDFEKNLKIINSLYLNLPKDLDSELLNAVKDIVEQFNNLSTLRIDYSKGLNDKELIDEFINKLNNFSYKPITEFKLENTLSIEKVKLIDKKFFDEFKIDKSNAHSFSCKDFSVTDLKNKYGDTFFLYFCEEADVYILFNCDRDNHLVSIVDDYNDTTLFKEAKEALIRSAYLDKSCSINEHNIQFNLNKDGFNIEIVHIINNLYRKYVHLLNSSSFRGNQLFLFDVNTISCSTDELNRNIDWIKQYMSNIIK